MYEMQKTYKINNHNPTFFSPAFKGGVIIVFMLFLIDRFLRYLALENYNSNEKIRNLIFSPAFQDGFFVFEKNFSLAFGLPLPQVLVYTLISAILLVLFFLILWSYKKKNLFFIISFTLIFLGSLNNLIDRFSYGYVIDYLNFFPFPIFNLGDIMVVGGVGMVIKSKVCKVHKVESL